MIIASMKPPLIRSIFRTCGTKFNLLTTPSSSLSTASSAATAQINDNKQDDNFSPKIVRLIDEIATLSLLEVADLNKALKKKLNLPDSPMFSAASMVLPAAAPAQTEEQSAPDVATVKTKFSVKLTKIDESKKIAIIKEIKSIVPNLNLVQAKKLVETLPQTVKSDILKDEAEKLLAQLTALGATCEID